MADIRINSLSTTASASSSDDFLAIDGTTNGTRKLNAYSPTFGGNLTVSGTGTNDFSGNIRLANNKFLYGYTTTGATGAIAVGTSSDNLNIGQNNANWAALNLYGGTGNVTIVPAGTTAATFTSTTTTLAGNLTVSGTGTSSFAGDLSLLKKTGLAATILTIDRYSNGIGGGTTLLTNGTSDWFFGLRGTVDSDFHIYSYGTSADVLSIARATGNATLAGNLTVSGTGNSSVAGTLLVATTTNSSNGKLQLADHTTSAGGIGFGSDVALFRAGGNTLRLNLGVSAAALWFDNGGLGTGGARILGSSGALTVTSNGANSVYLQTGGTTALTLDSSQRMFTASAAKIGSTSGTVDSRLHVYESTAVSTSNGLTLEQASTGDSLLSFLLTGVQRWSVGIDNSDSDKFKIGTGDLGAADKFTVDTSGNATVAGSIAIGNTVQTAVAVASTHKVTISIGGSTYYLLATNV